jgi:iron-sulfur cluster repair protein YtfE (RIC family)
MLAERYQAPNDASPELRACYDALEALDRGLQEHVALEEDVLFPAAVRAEGGGP